MTKSSVLPGNIASLDAGTDLQLYLSLTIVLGALWLLSLYVRSKKNSASVQECRITPVQTLGRCNKIVALDYNGEQFLLNVSPNGVNFLCGLSKVKDSGESGSDEAAKLPRAISLVCMV